MASNYEQVVDDLRQADNLTADHRILALTDRAASAIEELTKPKQTDYSELVKALRQCAEGCNPKSCAYGGRDCNDLPRDAAAAIEALQKRLVNALTALHLANEKMGYYGIQPYTEADGDDMISDWVKTLVHEELEQQMPKRGDWVWKHRHHGGFKTAKGKCECGRDVYAQIDERYETDDPYCPFCGVMNDSIHLNYCPNCGADMRAKMEGCE